MIALLTLIGSALVLGLLLGVAVGRLAGLPRTRLAAASAFALVLAVAVAGGLSVAGLVPGQPGLWIEITALVLGAYLIGAGFGAMSVR
ncbi:hypothetical protein [Methylobacterium gossipiicola]|uniref:Major facilitator superfamily (MFS) profile domain-containing protein n=1 Tax=Methylobacterium gossipiicola TaxID=582675 RepID=A0A1I2UGD7_9HYPH|nr:hypothetical protein [Methylobacterium gossipiicola]SFG76073.1 hypothetical protein SAMN05192565_11062 [Methylobacterium gossipiicola]